MKFHKIIAAGLVCCSMGTVMTSCEDFFETDSNRQVFDPALDQKTDSMFYTLGILKGLQQVADQYVLTGEMRGDLVATNSYTETDLRRLANFSADATCKYDSAYKYYRIINNCNYFIAHRDTTLLTGSRRVAIPEYVQALAVRAWAYMQLCKDYGEVPFFTDPITSIGEANQQQNKVDLQFICDALTPELIKFSGTPVPTYGNDINAGTLNGSNSESPVEKKVDSRRMMIPVDVILGDLFLETHQYEKAAKYYFNFLVQNKWTMDGAYVAPTGSSYLMNLLYELMPSSMTAIYSGTSWANIFDVSNTQRATDIVTYIPLAANRLRGEVSELPRYFGYDFYSTATNLSNSNINDNPRYMLERQIDASASYVALSNAQDYYYTPAQDGAITDVRTVAFGDLRRLITMHQVARNDSLFGVMIKYNSANVYLYRTPTIYLRLAEAINRMGYPDAAFAILKDGISDELDRYVLKGDSTDAKSKRYIRPETALMLQTTVPFLSEENVSTFEENQPIHSRGTYYTMGSYSPYQMDTIVAQKLNELKALHSIMPTGTIQDTINAVEDIICDEMALELAFEGSRFGDLTRMARHKNLAGLYGSTFGSKWLARKLAYKQPVKDLTDERNWYLPFK